MIILDTDALTFLERQGNLVYEQLRDRLAILSLEHDVVTTIITYEEQTRGWFKELAQARSPDAEVEAYANLLQHLQAFREMEVLPYTMAEDIYFRQLRSQKIRVGSMDLKIAATALSHDAILLTRNLRDFSKIHNLHVEDWTKS